MLFQFQIHGFSASKKARIAPQISALNRARQVLNGNLCSDSCKYTVVKLDGSTPKRWISKGAMINQYMGVAPSTFQVVYMQKYDEIWYFGDVFGFGAVVRCIRICIFCIAVCVLFLVGGCKTIT